MSVTLGLDSASKTGWAVLDGERLIEHGVMSTRAEDRIDAHKVDTFAAMAVGRFKPDVVVIEDAYLDKNVQTVKFLSRLAGHWEHAFGVRGVHTELVLADVWQQGVLAGLISRSSNRAERKYAAGLWVSRTFRGLKVDVDTADAIGMAMFVARRDAFAARVAAARARAR
jgi:Holliday junction resolvasome RuvABC endonuclease subunit